VQLYCTQGRYACTCLHGCSHDGERRVRKCMRMKQYVCRCTHNMRTWLQTFYRASTCWPRGCMTSCALQHIPCSYAWARLCIIGKCSSVHTTLQRLWQPGRIRDVRDGTSGHPPHSNCTLSTYGCAAPPATMLVVGHVHTRIYSAPPACAIANDDLNQILSVSEASASHASSAANLKECK
jgi:hypothetical protein